MDGVATFHIIAGLASSAAPWCSARSGNSIVAGRATAVASKNLQAGRKSEIPVRGLEQLREDVGQAEDAYNAACDHANGVARTRRKPVPRPRRSRW